MKIFLGGTCNETTWRDELIPKLRKADIDYYNPVVDDWTIEDQVEEERQKEDVCSTHLYYITSEMTGMFSIAEAVHSAHTAKACIFAFRPNGFETHQTKSLLAVGRLIESIGGHFIVDNGSFSNIVDILKKLAV